jgi:hypothetical protein
MSKNIHGLLQDGGKVVASGGFGCIFKPELQCENEQKSRDPNKISKLMTSKHAKEEYNQIQKFKSILQKVPNYQNYYLLNNFSICKPAQLTREDLLKYDKKCKALTKKNIKSKNINQSLDKILAINMPNGGINVDDYIQKYFSISNLIQLNNSLIDLLINGIIPMNKLNVYHCDIKDANVLLQTDKSVLHARLIDWGLSFIVEGGHVKGIPKKIYRRPFQYNVPFSSILFNKDFLKNYDHFLSVTPNPDYFQIREFVINYIFMWNEIRGPGHLDAINDIFIEFSGKDLIAIKSKKIKNHLIEYDFTYYYIIEYLSKILDKYTYNGHINLLEYINKIFLKNIDIWGFVIVYLAMFEHLYKYFHQLNEYQMQLINKIKYIIIHFLYENPNQIIPVEDLVLELKGLNSIIAKCNVNEESQKLRYLKESNISTEKTDKQSFSNNTKRRNKRKRNRKYSKSKTKKNKNKLIN